MINGSALGQTIASDTAHVLYPLCDCRLLHSLVNGRISISGTCGGHTAKGIDSYYKGRNSGACRHTDNDYGLTESHEERQYRSRPPLLRALWHRARYASHLVFGRLSPAVLDPYFAAVPDAYRVVRDMLLARIKERFGAPPVGNE